MANPSPADLAAEIASDPAGLGYAGKADGDIAALLNAKSFTRTQPIPLLSVLQFAAATGMRSLIEDMSRNMAPELTGLRSLCLGFIDMCWGVGTSHVFDVTDPAIVGPGGMLDSMVAGGIMTADQRAGLIAIGTVPASRAEVLWGFGVLIHNLDVAAALRGGA